MTITESDVAAPTTAPSVTTAVQPRGLYELVTTGDHTTLGRLYVLCSAIFLVGVGVLGVLSGAERLDTTSVDLFGGAKPPIPSRRCATARRKARPSR